MNERQKAVNEMLIRVAQDLKRGLIHGVSFDFIGYESSEGLPIVDRNGDYIFVGDVMVRFPAYEKTLAEDTVKALRAAADSIEQLDIDTSVSVSPKRKNVKR